MKYFFLLISILAMMAVLGPAGLSQPEHLRFNHPPLGKLIDVGGHRLHINCEGKGNPTVVMEAGAGDFSFDWSLVEPTVAKFSRVCTYDRAGYAWSEPGPTPRTLRQIVYELHTGLANGKIKGPYVMVGHSLGGLIVRQFAARYPAEVVGIILVDSASEDQLVGITDPETKKGKVVRWRTLSKNRKIPPVQETMSAVSDVSKHSDSNLQSVTVPKPGFPFDQLSPKNQFLREWAKSRPAFIPARISEFDYIADEIAAMFAEGKKLGDIPLIVIAREHTTAPGSDDADIKMLDEEYQQRKVFLTSLSTNSKLLISKGKDHHIQLDDPKTVTDAIQNVVKSVRARKNLR